MIVVKIFFLLCIPVILVTTYLGARYFKKVDSAVKKFNQKQFKDFKDFKENEEEK